MRKRCAVCGLIAFASDDTCRRCGSEKLFKYAAQGEAPNTTTDSKKNLTFWRYPVCFVLACFFEFVALLPVLANIGWKHSANAPITQAEREFQIAAFVLHLPTSLLVWLSNGSLLDVFVMMAAPLIQIVFWTFALSFIWGKIHGRKIR